jgi:hypothetical protein
MEMLCLMIFELFDVGLARLFFPMAVRPLPTHAPLPRSAELSNHTGDPVQNSKKNAAKHLETKKMSYYGSLLFPRRIKR